MGLPRTVNSEADLGERGTGRLVLPRCQGLASGRPVLTLTSDCPSMEGDSKLGLARV